MSLHCRPENLHCISRQQTWWPMCTYTLSHQIRRRLSTLRSCAMQQLRTKTTILRPSLLTRWANATRECRTMGRQWFALRSNFSSLGSLGMWSRRWALMMDLLFNTSIWASSRKVSTIMRGYAGAGLSLIFRLSKRWVRATSRKETPLTKATSQAPSTVWLPT